MHIVIILIIVTICVFYIIHSKKKHSTQVFFENCTNLMTDKRVTQDLGPIIEKLVYLVDQRSSLEYSESRVKLVGLFEKVQEIKCFTSMEPEITTLFQITDKMLENKN